MKKILSLFLLTILLFPIITLAQQQQGAGSSHGDQPTIVNPLGRDDPAVIIGDVIKGVLGITGIIALIAFVAGGLMWMTSGGSAEKVKKGRDIIIWAVIGLFIVFSSYTILRYVFQAFEGG